MFSFLRRDRDAFQQRRTQQDVWKRVRRLVDASSPNLLHAAEESRSDNRHNRCLPAILVPFVGDEPQLDEHVLAVTWDFSDEGVSLLCNQELATPQVICVFWDDGPMFLLGNVRQVRPIGAGYWRVGVHFDEVLPGGQLHLLSSLAAQLVPDQAEPQLAS